MLSARGSCLLTLVALTAVLGCEAGGRRSSGFGGGSPGGWPEGPSEGPDADGDSSSSDGDADGDHGSTGDEAGDDDPDGDAGDDTGDGASGDGDGSGDAGVPAFKWDLGDVEDGSSGCQAVSFQPVFARPQVMLVLDRSGSMKGERWSTLMAAVQALVDAHGAALDLGLRFFPQDGVTCSEDVVDIPAASDTGAAILAAMAATTPWGNTPTRPAIAASTLHLQSLSEDPSGLAAPRRMILVADGDANDCGDPADVTAAIAAAAAAGIPTNVVAVATGLTEIDAWAAAGGTVAAVSAADLASLSAALQDAATAVKSCAFGLEPAPIWPSLVEVEVDGSLLHRGETCEGAADFRIVGGPPWALELCPSICAGVTPNSSVDVTYRCPPG